MPLSGLSSLGSLAGSLPSLAGPGNTNPATAPAASAASGPSWLTGELAQIVTVLLGLILIVAGLFSFKQVQQVSGAAVRAAAA